MSCIGMCGAKGLGFRAVLFCLYNTIQYNSTQYNTIQYNSTQYNTIQYNTTQYNTTQYNTIQHNTIQYLLHQMKGSVAECLSQTAINGSQYMISV